MTSTYNFYRNTGRIIWEQMLAYQTEQRILRERFMLREQAVALIDDNGTSYHPYAYIDGTKQQMKVFQIQTVPSHAVIRFFAGWREDDNDSRLDSTVLMTVNGSAYRVNDLLSFAESPAGPTNWVEVLINPADLRVGQNEVIFQFSPRVGKEYFYLGLSAAVRGRSALSSDGGATWNTTDLSPASGVQPGEYMVQMYLDRAISWPGVRAWDASRDQLALTARMNRYSPRLLLIPFLYNRPGLVVSGNDLGGANVDEIALTPTGFDAFVYRDTNAAFDANVDPNTGEPFDPENYTSQRLIDIVRRPGEVVRASISLNLAPSLPDVVVTKSRWPRNYRAAWTVGDDTDQATSDTKRAAYYGARNPTDPDYGRKGFAGHNLKITVTTWWQKGSQGIANPGDYRGVMLDLYQRGFEVGLHTATDLQDARGVTLNAVNAFSQIFDHYTWLEHSPHECQPSKGPQANLEDLQCYGALSNSSKWYVLDILENSSIRYLCPASVSMLTGCSAGSFSTPWCLPHETSYVDDPTNSKRLLIAGRTGRAYSVSTNPSKIDSIIANRDLLVGYTHTAADGWLTYDSARIANGPEANLSYIQQRQDSGALWVQPIYRIFDWMTNWEKLTIENMYQLDGWTHVDIANRLDVPVRGLTLVASTPIAEVKTGGVHQIYVDGQQVTAPALEPGKPRHLEILPGSYNPDLPRLTQVDTDVDVLSAEYSSQTGRATVELAFSGFGISTGRQMKLQCGRLHSFYARDNGYRFAIIQRGRPPVADPVYAVQHDPLTGELRFVLPETYPARTVVLEPSLTTGVTPRTPDFDLDGDVDDADLRFFVGCATGSQIPPASPVCEPADLDGDGDIDQVDFAALQRQFTVLPVTSTGN